MTLDDILLERGLAAVWTDLQADENIFSYGEEEYRLPCGAVSCFHITLDGRKREVYVAKIADVRAAADRTLH